MQPAYYNNLDEVNKKLWDMIEEAVKNRHSSFHIPVMINGSKDQMGGRVVVLRNANSKNKTIRFHSDIRSSKIDLIKKDPIIFFIFYDKEEKIQLRVLGKAILNYKNTVTKNSWKKTTHMSRKCYLATQPPGTISHEPTSGISDKIENLKYTIEESQAGYENFCVIETKIKSIEWLYLAAKGHRRAKFEYIENEIKKKWLTP
tara:strand:- start:13 stop:618 length:606 start_codon:yes stop_codon:yes gene_type:complete